MEILYKFKGQLYTHDKLFFKYLYSRMRNKISFDEWFDNNLSNGVIVNYTKNIDNLTLEEVLNYAYYHNLNEMHFQDSDGKCFTIKDAQLGLIRIEGEDKLFTFEDLEISYKNKQEFNICR